MSIVRRMARSLGAAFGIALLGFPALSRKAPNRRSASAARWR